MKIILRYSFLLLLILSCLIVVPFTLIRDTLQTEEEETAATTLQFIPSTRPRPTTVTTTTVTTTTTTVPDGTNGTFDTDSAATTTEVPTTTAAPTTTLTQTQEEAFADTLFIGDSRTFGFISYNINVPGATFFSSEGMSASAVLKRAVNVPGMGEMTFDELLQKKTFKVVYLMFGLNEINNKYSNETIAAHYQQIIGRIAEIQPDAQVVVQSTLHITKNKNNANIKSKSRITNERIDALNVLLTRLVDEPYVYFLDINEAFDTPDHALNTDFAASDGMHVNVRGYKTWRDFLFEKRIR